jgi:hypothetical protein
MTTAHPSDMELQQYAMDKTGCTAEAITHIDACESCQAGIAAYRLLFSEITERPKPAFDFDVSALVLPALPPAPVKTPPERAFGYWFAVIACCVAGIPLYLFRKNIFFLFGGISVYFIYVILAAALPVVVLRCLGMYRKFQQQMNSLNVY